MVPRSFSAPHGVKAVAPQAFAEGWAGATPAGHPGGMLNGSVAKGVVGGIAAYNGLSRTPGGGYHGHRHPRYRGGGFFDPGGPEMELGLDDVLEGDAASGAETYGTTGHRRSEATSGSRLRTHDRSREREAR